MFPEVVKMIFLDFPLYLRKGYFVCLGGDFDFGAESTCNVSFSFSLSQGLVNNARTTILTGF